MHLPQSTQRIAGETILCVKLNAVFFEAFAKRLSCRKGFIRHSVFQAFTDWIPANNLPE